MRTLILIGLGLAAVGCHPHHSGRVGVRHGGVQMGTNENVHDKRHAWFQGLYRDCVHGNQAQACFKTGQNIEDGVVAPPNAADAHWFYAKACDLQAYDMYCEAAYRTDPTIEPVDDGHEAAR